MSLLADAWRALGVARYRVVVTAATKIERRGVAGKTKVVEERGQARR